MGDGHLSYLDLPRLIFDGEFQADVSTVNNIVANYDIETFDPDTSPLSWNPDGTAAFRLLNCTVRGVADDRRSDHDDPVLTAVIGGSTDRVAGKIVDLDTQWQLCSALWGLRIELRAGDTTIVAGEFEPASFRDIWFPPPVGDQVARPTARFQSVLANLRWAKPGVSPFADRLRAATTGGKLSIRLTTFAFYNADKSAAQFAFGGVVGAIGPYRPGEPHRFLPGRRFAPIVTEQGLNTAGINYFDGVVHGDRLVVDLANAMPILDDKGSIIDQGELRLGVLLDPAADQGATLTEGTGFAGLGDPLPYRDAGWLLDTSGIATVRIPGHLDTTARPLALLRRDEGGHTVVVRETLSGWHVRAEDHVHRVEAGGTLSTTVYVTRYGRPIHRAEVVPELLPPIDSGFEPVIGTPPDAFTIQRPSPTGEDGRTTLRVRCSDPGTPRAYLDGQIYLVQLGIMGVDLAALRHNPLEPMAALVFDHFEVPDCPTWYDDIRPIFTQYANLYPIMSKRLVRLDRYEDVRRHRGILQFAFSRDVGDPNYMPVTRDLSQAKRRMILRWLALPDLPLGTPPPPVPAAGVTPPAPVPEDDAVDPTDSKAQFVRRYLRAMGRSEQ
jgi:hypothetical protein